MRDAQLLQCDYFYAVIRSSTGIGLSCLSAGRAAVQRCMCATQPLDLSAVAWTRHPSLHASLGRLSPPFDPSPPPCRLMKLSPTSFGFGTRFSIRLQLLRPPYERCRRAKFWASVTDPVPLGICSVGTRKDKTSAVPARVPSLLDASLPFQRTRHRYYSDYNHSRQSTSRGLN